MTLEFLANYADVFGGIAVFISLVYLAFQVRANTREQKHQRRFDSFEIQNSVFNYIVESPEATKLYMKAAEDYMSLDDEERVKFGLMMVKTCHAFDLIMQMYQEGSIDFDTYNSFEEFVFGTLEAPGVRYWWNNMPFAGRVVPRVRKRINELYAKSDAEDREAGSDA